MTGKGTMGTILASVVVLGTSAGLARSQEPDRSKIAALVNGEPILASEVKALLDQRKSPVPLPKAAEKEMWNGAVEVLIEELIMRQFLRKNAPAPKANDIQKERAELVDVLKKQGKTLEQFLREGQQTEDQLRADIVARLQWKSYLAATIREADLKNYYQDNKPYFDKVTVRASHILVKVPDQASPSERQVARAKADTIRQEIVTGKLSFVDAVRQYSDCPSKKKDGDIGHFPFKFVVVEPIARAAFSLKEKQISEVIPSEFGYHILLVTDRTAGVPSNYETIKEPVREAYAQEFELYPKLLNEQRKLAKVEIPNP